MKVGTLTFHGAHNYGSVLQAYALQKALDSLIGKDNHEIINLRKQTQKDYYSVYNKGKGIKGFIGNLYNFRHRKQLKEKHAKFEKFIEEYLPLSPELSEYGQVEDVIKEYDNIICGSDQIWNMNAFDFDLSYMLPFEYVNKRISYAASFGGNVSLLDERDEEIKQFISKFDYVSVRESESQNKLSKICDRDVKKVPDPTILLEPYEWECLIDKKQDDEDYILFYSLGPMEKDIDLINSIADRLGCKIIITNTANRYDKMMKAERLLDSGPLDFLSLIKGAKLVCTTSFHCTVFSIVFGIPFFCINVEQDDRINSLLENTGLLERHIKNDDFETKIKNAFDSIDFTKADEKLRNEREHGLNYLKEALGIGNDL